MLFFRSFTARIIWSSCIAISVPRWLRLPLRFVEITHRTRDVPFRVAELDKFADTGNHHLGHGDMAALLLDEPGDRVHIIDGDGTLKADAAMAVSRAVVNRAVNARVL